MVDAQALVLLEGAGLIVPERVAVRLVVTGAERIRQAEIDQRLEMRARLGPEQRVVHPGARVVDVLGRRDDVEVAGDDHRLLVQQQRLDALLEPRHPGELVDIFLGAAVAVRQIDIDEAKRAGGHRDHRFEIARLHVVGIAGEPGRDLVEREAWRAAPPR